MSEDEDDTSGNNQSMRISLVPDPPVNADSEKKSLSQRSRRRGPPKTVIFGISSATNSSSVQPVGFTPGSGIPDISLPMSNMILPDSSMIDMSSGGGDYVVGKLGSGSGSKYVQQKYVELSELINRYVIRSDHHGSLTHTTLTNPQGREYSAKLSVPPEDEIEFLRVVARANKDGSKLGLIEQHPKINCCPITIDLDFRFPIDMEELQESSTKSIRRFCTQKHILNFIELVHRKYVEYLQIRSPAEYYVTRRPAAIFDEKKGLLVDGVHIQCKEIQTTPDNHYFIREKVIKEMSDIFEESLFCRHKGHSYSNIFDKCVIYSTGLYLYGCTKKDRDPYMLEMICVAQPFIDSDTQHAIIDILPEIQLTDIRNNIEDLTIKLSIRVGVNNEPISIRPEKSEEIQPSLRRQTQKLIHENAILTDVLRSQVESVPALAATASAAQPAPIPVGVSGNLQSTSIIAAKKTTGNFVSDGGSGRGETQMIASSSGGGSGGRFIDCGPAGLYDISHLTVDKINNVYYVDRLLDCLLPERASNYDTWIRVGWCLHNMSIHTDYSTDLFPLWVKFSSKSPRFNIHEVSEWRQKYWDKCTNTGAGYSFASLVYWAKQDSSLEHIRAIQFNYQKSYLEACITGKGGTVLLARLIHSKYKHQFVCTDITNKEWYFCDEHTHYRWIRTDSGHKLRYKIMTEIAADFSLYLNELTQMQVQQHQTGGDANAMRDRFMSIANIVSKLATTGNLDTIMSECRYNFYDPDFFNTLDKKWNLLVFNNGVYDLETREFRQIYPEDRVSLSTNLNYYDYNPHEHNPNIQQILAFYSQIQPDEAERNYLLTIAASCLEGRNREEKFHVFTGEGGNGKSKWVDLMNYTLGDYAGKINITNFTQKRASATSAQPDLVDLKDKRFITMEEPDDREQLHMGLLKQVTGGDVIKARGLYQRDFFKFQVVGKLILGCNTKPEVNGNDRGTWRRIRVLHWPTKFMPNPDTSDRYQHRIDPQLGEKLREWAQDHISFLVHIYNTVYRPCMGVINEPPSVIKHTQEYQAQCDMYTQYRIDRIEEGRPDQVLVMPALKRDFLQWHSQNFRGQIQPKPAEINERFIKILGTPHPSFKGWVGIRLKPIIQAEIATSADGSTPPSSSSSAKSPDDLTGSEKITIKEVDSVEIPNVQALSGAGTPISKSKK